MIINHPILGPRDSSEFYILGDSKLIDRPDWQAENAQELFYEYLYERDNPAGLYEELWYHEFGDRAWLVVSRDTVSHKIEKVELATEVAHSRGRSK